MSQPVESFFDECRSTIVKKQTDLIFSEIQKAADNCQQTVCIWIPSDLYRKGLHSELLPEVTQLFKDRALITRVGQEPKYTVHFTKESIAKVKQEIQSRQEREQEEQARTSIRVEKLKAAIAKIADEHKICITPPTLANLQNFYSPMPEMILDLMVRLLDSESYDPKMFGTLLPDLMTTIF